MDAPISEKPESRSQWMRLLYMILFAFIYGVTEAVVGAVVLIQLLTALITRHPNERLARFGQQLSAFVYEILRFVTYATERKPFPFHDWPRSEPGQPRPSETEGSPHAA